MSIISGPDVYIIKIFIWELWYKHKNWLRIIVHLAQYFDFNTWHSAWLMNCRIIQTLPGGVRILRSLLFISLDYLWFGTSCAWRSICLNHLSTILRTMRPSTVHRVVKSFLKNICYRTCRAIFLLKWKAEPIAHIMLATGISVPSVCAFTMLPLPPAIISSITHGEIQGHHILRVFLP